MTTRPRNVVIDIDGVIGDFNTPFAKKLSEFSGIPLDQFTFTEWYWYEKTGISKKLVSKAWDSIIEDPVGRWDFWFHRVAALPEVVDPLKDLIDSPIFNPIFVTARNPRTYVATYEWLRNRFGFPYPQLIMSQRKGFICEALNAFAFIDDKYENCLDVLRMRGTSTLVALCDQPYNRSKVLHPYMHRLSGMHEFLAFIGDRA